MPTLTKEANIDAAAGEVWRIAGDPARIADWLPPIASSRVEGERRFCTLADDGGQIEEKILEHSDERRRYRYEILEGPMPLSSYVSTFEVAERDGRAHVFWTADFVPEDPGAEQELVQTFDEIYEGGLEALRQRAESTE